jgi:hypothetical protein
VERSIAIIGIMCVMFTTKVQAQGTVAQNGDRIVVTLSDPARPGLLKISMVNGGITVRSHTGRDIIIEGRAVGRSGPIVTPDGLTRIGPSRTGLVVVEEKNVVTVSSGAFNAPDNLEIQVPAKTNLALSTVNGNSITVEGVEGDVEVSNTNGHVRLSGLMGSVVAHSHNGNLFAVFRELSGNKPMSFTSMNGNIDVTLPPSAKANLRIRTDNGEGRTDFELQRLPGPAPKIEDDRTRGGQGRIITDTTINATINGGGTDLELRTLNGNILIRKAK